MTKQISISQITDKDIARFWSHVDKSGECWNWTAARIKSYGVFFLGKRNLYAHRVAWFITYGAIEIGLCVCHKCDNGLCVRPDHLFLGTHADNSHDMVAKGRSARGHKQGAYTHPESRQKLYGERNGQSKLTLAQVREIRRLATSKLSQRVIASMFGIRQSEVSRIILRQRWNID